MICSENASRYPFQRCLKVLLVLIATVSAFWTPPPLPSTDQLSRGDPPSHRVASWLLRMNASAGSEIGRIPPPQPSPAHWSPATSLRDWNSWFVAHFSPSNSSDTAVMETCTNVIVAAHAPWCRFSDVEQRLEALPDWRLRANVRWIEDDTQAAVQRASGGKIMIPAFSSPIDMSLAFKTKTRKRSSNAKIDVCFIVTASESVELEANDWLMTTGLSGLVIDAPHRLHTLVAERTHGRAKQLLSKWRESLPPSTSSFVGFSYDTDADDDDAAYRAGAAVCHLVAGESSQAQALNEPPSFVMALFAAVGALRRKVTTLRVPHADGSLHLEVADKPMTKRRVSRGGRSFTILSLPGMLPRAYYAVPDSCEVRSEDVIVFPARESSPLFMNQVARGSFVGGSRAVHAWLRSLSTTRRAAAENAESDHTAALKLVVRQNGLTLRFLDLPLLSREESSEASKDTRAVLAHAPRCMAFATVPDIVSNTSTHTSAYELVRVQLAPRPMESCLKQQHLPSCYMPAKREFRFLGPSRRSRGVDERRSEPELSQLFRFVGAVFFREGLCIYGGPKWTARTYIAAWYPRHGIETSLENSNEHDQLSRPESHCGALCTSERSVEADFARLLLRDDVINQLEADEDVPRKTPNLPPVHVKRQVVNPKGKGA